MRRTDTYFNRFVFGLLTAILALTGFGFMIVAPGMSMLQIDPTQQQSTVDAAVEQLFTATAELQITATIDAAFKQAVAETAAALATPTPTATFTPEPFRVDSLEVQEVHTLDMLAGPAGTGAYLAPDGQHFAYLKENQICLYTITGELQQCVGFDPEFRGLDPDSIRWSADSRYLVMTSDFLRYFMEPDLYVVDTVDGTMKNITRDTVLKIDIGKFDEFAGWIDIAPRWVGDTIYFIRYTQSAGVFAPPALWRVQADGSGAERVGTFSTLDRFSIYAFAISPDGQQVAYNFYAPGGDDRRNGIWLSNLNGSQAEQLIALPAEFIPFSLDFSPDGRYVLSVSGAAGAFGTEATAETSPAFVVSLTDGVRIPISPSLYVFSAGWSPTGSALVYTTHDIRNPDSEGLYVTNQPGEAGSLLQTGTFAVATSRVTQTIPWTASNAVMVALTRESKLSIFELGTN